MRISIKTVDQPRLQTFENIVGDESIEYLINQSPVTFQMSETGICYFVNKSNQKCFIFNE